MFWVIVAIGIVALVGYKFFNSMNRGENEPQYQSVNKDSQEVENFRSGFTNQQKAAIISSMIIVTKTPNGITKVEWHYIEKLAILLKIGLDDPELETIPQKGRVNLVSILNTLSRSDKDWFSYSLYTLLYQNGKPEGNKLQIALTILNDIGISQDEFISVVDKSNALYKRLMR